MGEMLEFSRSPEAVQIIDIVDHTLKLELETVIRILEADNVKDRNVVVVSIAGSLRKGKSFLLNFFLKYLNAQYKKHDVRDWIGESQNEGNNELNGFKWRGGKDRETVGIWMWSEIFTYDYEKGDGVAIILMDTQGIFDNESSLKDCISIFAISMLLSSVQCCNFMRGVQEDDLQHLELFMEYARLAMDATSEKPFQELLFIIRDWPFPYENDYGYSREYIDGVLAESEKQTPEMRKLRENIKSCFNDVNAFLLPHPGKSVAQQKDFGGDLRQIDSDFVEYVKNLVPSILAPENLIVKQINGENVRAREFVTYLAEYVNTFNGDELPKPQSILMATAQVQIRSVYEKCLDVYVSAMQEAFDNLEGYFEERELDQKHDNAKEASLSLFRNKRKLGGELLISEWMEKLNIAIRRKYHGFRNTNKARKAGISSTKNKILGWVATGTAAIAGGAALAVAGPFGWGIVLSEAGTLLLSAVTTGSAAGGAGLGAGITKAVTSFLPDRWFRNRSIETAAEAQESVGTVASANPFAAVGGTISRHIATVQETIFGFLFRR